RVQETGREREQRDVVVTGRGQDRNLGQAVQEVPGRSKLAATRALGDVARDNDRARRELFHQLTQRALDRRDLGAEMGVRNLKDGSAHAPASRSASGVSSQSGSSATRNTRGGFIQCTSPSSATLSLRTPR